MTKAFKTFIDYGFRELGLNRIEVNIAVENKRSRALAERQGFIEEGRLRQAEWL
ncbi:GNAT family N-acetyltransferase [Peribacillus butanolivorans]